MVATRGWVHPLRNVGCSRPDLIYSAPADRIAQLEENIEKSIEDRHLSYTSLSQSHGRRSPVVLPLGSASLMVQVVHRYRSAHFRSIGNGNPTFSCPVRVESGYAVLPATHRFVASSTASTAAVSALSFTSALPVSRALSAPAAPSRPQTRTPGRTPRTACSPRAPAPGRRPLALRNRRQRRPRRQLHPATVALDPLGVPHKHLVAAPQRHLAPDALRPRPANLHVLEIQRAPVVLAVRTPPRRTPRAGSTVSIGLEARASAAPTSSPR